MFLRPTPKRAFTLVELLVVIAIIGILVALLLPAIQAAREAARRADCTNRIKQVSFATLNFEGATKHYPAATIVNPQGTPPGQAAAYWGYIVQILPYMEYANLAAGIDMKTHWQNEPNVTFLYNTEVPAFRCPSHPDQDVTYADPSGSSGTQELPTNLRAHYMGVMGASSGCPMVTTNGYPDNTYTMMLDKNGNVACGSGGGVATNGVITMASGGGNAYPQVNIRSKDVTDGTSHTFMIGEISWNCGPQRIWAIGSGTGPTTGALYSFHYTSKNVRYPLNTAYRSEASQPPSGYENNDMSFGSLHPGGCHFALCDGSVQFVHEDIATVVLKALASRKSQETTQSDAF